MTVTRTPADWISPSLLARLLAALEPIVLDENTNQFHVGYFTAQRDFRFILANKANIRLPEIKE